MPVLTADLLQKAGFRHGFSLAPANFSLLRTDRAGLVADQEALANELGFDPSRLFQATQVHGNVVVEAGSSRDALEGLNADAVTSNVSGDVVAVRVADCIAILVGDRATRRVTAIHAGWPGVVAGVIDAAIPRAGTDLVCALGPSIGPCCFEVGHDVAEKICNAAGEDVRVRKTDAKASIDLRRAARLQLRRNHVQDANMEDVGGCSICEKRFHSHRRDGTASGRMIAVIARA